MNEQTGGGAPTPDGSTDDGFVYESASAPFTAAPDDTTAHLDAQPQGEPAGTGDAENAVADEGDTPADGETSGESAGTPAPAAAAAPAGTPAAKPAGKGKSKETFGERIARLKGEVDTLTYTKHQTQREIDAAKAEAARLQAQIDTLKRQAGTAPGGMDAAAPGAGNAPAAKPGTGDKAAAAEPMPAHPKYRDYSTDEEYEAAVAKWQGDMAAWQDRRQQALEQRILSEVDNRSKSAADASAAQRAEEDFARRVTAMAAEDPNWTETIKPLQTLRSSWYDPTRHGENVPTPFLSDMVRNHPEGHLFLKDLAGLAGSDPDAAQRLADLIPSRYVRDALMMTPESIIVPLMRHFATPQGVQEFRALTTMHPMRMMQSLGALSARIAAAPSGSAATPQHPVTQAQPSRTATAGTPGARAQGQAPATGKPNDSFDAWMAAEDAKEEAKRKQLAGLQA